MADINEHTINEINVNIILNNFDILPSVNALATLNLNPKNKEEV